MSKRPTVSRESAMLEKGIARLFKSGDLLTAETLAVLTLQPTDQFSAELMAWKQAGDIFSLAHEGKEYFPLYAFDPASGYRPFSPFAAIITTLGSSKHNWAMAFWFGSSNSYLGGRMPKDVLIDDPMRVLDAALSTVCGALHG